MKNLIRVLLYLLLVLLVVAISVMMYKRFKTPADMEPTTEMLDSMFVDTAISSQNLPMTAEDSVILGLTGELPNQVGITEPDNGSIDYSGNTNNRSTASAPKENTSPVAKAVSNTGKAVKSSSSGSDDLPSVNLANSTKSESKAAPAATKTAKAAETTKSAKTTTSATKSKEVVKSNAAATTSKSGKYYVVAGSFIVPSHAEKQVSKLKSLGYATAAKRVFGNEEYYRAVAGQYDSREAAEKTVKNLKVKGQAAFIKMQ
ncbi:MAG: SPOR domain-containing protein [Saprospiraceae bacterium]|nr:SPOR domain-containing protein [Candidatus Vicinibacter affinis]MBK7800842.1 SPOR domain-containing protein [Candidatus Vicinibacter affinis]MBP6174251.1 SPOR domain-containing protein [Saprospiraceae bacterium]